MKKDGRSQREDREVRKRERENDDEGRENHGRAEYRMEKRKVGYGVVEKKEESSMAGMKRKETAKTVEKAVRIIDRR